MLPLFSSFFPLSAAPRGRRRPRGAGGDTARGTRMPPGVHHGFLVCIGLLAGGCGGAPALEPEPQPEPSAEAAAPPSGRSLAQVAGAAPPAAGMARSIVLLEPHAGVEVPLPEEAPIMDQFGRRFIPGFILVRAGQTIKFTNSEDDLHTVHVKDSAGESLFNVATMMGSTYEFTFELGDEYSVICNTHTEMFADILVVDTPYAVIADMDGAFVIPDVIPGAYTAAAIHRGERTEREVEVAAGENRIDLTGE